MEPSERDLKIDILTGLAELFDRTIKPRALELMIRNLERIPAVDLQIAVDHLIRNSKFMPTVAELIEAANEYGKPYLMGVTHIYLSDEDGRAAYQKMIDREDEEFRQINESNGRGG